METIANKEEFKKAVTRRVKKEILKVDVIDEKSFKKLYEEISTKYNLEELHELEVQEDKVLSQEELNDLKKATEEGLSKLDKNTRTALLAMQTANTALLEQVAQTTNTLKIEIEELKHLVHRDDLTKIYNRKWFADIMIDGVEKFKNSGVMAVIDLNKFKIVNDTYGHSTGDKVLKFIAYKLNEIEDCHVIRYGGDEFILISSGEKTIKELEKSVSDLRKEVEEKRLKAGNKIFTTSFSFGIARFSKGDCSREVFSDADEEMYKFKEANRS